MKSTAETTKLDYFMDVLLRNYCRVMEANEMLCQETNEMQEAMLVLFQENADMRHLLIQNGIEVAPSNVISSEELAELETLERI